LTKEVVTGGFQPRLPRHMEPSSPFSHSTSTLRLPSMKAWACSGLTPSTSLRASSERRFSTLSSKTGLGAVEWVKLYSNAPGIQKKRPISRTARTGLFLFIRIDQKKTTQGFQLRFLPHLQKPLPLPYTLLPKAPILYISGDQCQPESDAP